MALPPKIHFNLCANVTDKMPIKLHKLQYLQLLETLLNKELQVCEQQPRIE